MMNNLCLLFASKQAARDFVMKDKATNQVIPAELRAVVLRAIDAINLDCAEVLPNEEDAVIHGVEKVIKMEICSYALKKGPVTPDGWCHDEHKSLKLSAEVLVTHVYKDGLRRD